MEAFEYAGLEDGMDYLYDFFEQDLPARVAEESEFVPAGLEDVLGDNTLLDYVWLWIKDPGPRGFRSYVAAGGYLPAEVDEALVWRRNEWGFDTPPHIYWLARDGVTDADAPALAAGDFDFDFAAAEFGEFDLGVPGPGNSAAD